MISDERVAKYDLFISYYSGTGIDFARFLKKKLKDFGINAFLDEEDIPKSIKHDTDEWRKYIDNGILSSEQFVLIMTLGFNTRKEVLREIELAFKNNIERFFCKHKDLPNKSLIIEIMGKQVDLSNFQYIEFDDEPDLVRELGRELFGKESKRRHKDVFMERLAKIVSSEGLEQKEKEYPTIDIVVGPNQKITDWLSSTPENKWIIGNCPYRCTRVTPRRRIFECKTRQNEEFFRAHVDGFFHFVTPMVYSEDKDVFYVDLTVDQILEPLIYCIRVMKLKSVDFDQSIHVSLNNIDKIKLTFIGLMSSRTTYSFSEDSQNVEFRFRFNPKDAWIEHKKLFFRVFKELCTELGVVEIPNKWINIRLYRILSQMQSIHTGYVSSFPSVEMPSIDIEDFGFTDEEKITFPY